MSFLQKYDKFLNSKPWIAFVIIAGIFAIATNDPQTEPLYFILGIGLLIWGFYKIYKRTKLPKNNEKRAIDYLNERYAKGEITKEEYDKIKDDFEKSLKILLFAQNVLEKSLNNE